MYRNLLSKHLFLCYSFKNWGFINNRFVLTQHKIWQDIQVSSFMSASSCLICRMLMSNGKLSPGQSVMWDFAVSSLKATFTLSFPLISSAHISLHSGQSAHIFSSNPHFLSIVCAFVFISGQLGGEPHSSDPPLSLRVACWHELIFQHELYENHYSIPTAEIKTWLPHMKFAFFILSESFSVIVIIVGNEMRELWFVRWDAFPLIPLSLQFMKRGQH